MLFRLDELHKGKEVITEFDLEREEIQTPSGDTIVQNLSAELKFRIDPLGFVVQYTIRAAALCECVRCAGHLQVEVNKSDLISLRVQQPEEGHILLNNTEMNVRFITDKNFDIKRFVCEIVELALPSYPRHEDQDPQCKIHGLDQEMEEEPEASPFDQLSKYLDKSV